MNQSKLAGQKEELETGLLSLRKQARAITALGEFSLLYAEHGATGLNANTLRDLTLYYVTLPAEKIELWFWLESERLLQPVFREFAKEIQVVQEERRMRVDSTPTGRQDEELRQRFWGDHPYRRHKRCPDRFEQRVVRRHRTADLRRSQCSNRE